MNLYIDVAIFLVINYFKYVVFAKYSTEGMRYTIFLLVGHISSLNIVHPKQSTFSNINLYLSFGVYNIPLEELLRLFVEDFESE